MQTVTYTLPAYWASYLINEDSSGLTLDEKCAAGRFLEENNLPFPVSCSDEAYFSRHNDAGTLACNVLDYAFL